MKPRYDDHTISFARGQPASPGKATGSVKRIADIDRLATVKEGEILVIPHASTLFVPALFKASAVVAGSGGPLCNLATILWELHIPGVVGIGEESLKILRDGMMVSVDGTEGTITLAGFDKREWLYVHHPELALFSESPLFTPYFVDGVARTLKHGITSVITKLTKIQGGETWEGLL